VERAKIREAMYLRRHRGGRALGPQMASIRRVALAVRSAPPCLPPRPGQRFFREAVPAITTRRRRVQVALNEGKSEAIFFIGRYLKFFPSALSCSRYCW